VRHGAGGAPDDLTEGLPYPNPTVIQKPLLALAKAQEIDPDEQRLDKIQA
jgi:hypothetical protein